MATRWSQGAVYKHKTAWKTHVLNYLGNYKRDNKVSILFAEDLRTSQLEAANLKPVVWLKVGHGGTNRKYAIWRFADVRREVQHDEDIFRISRELVHFVFHLRALAPPTPASVSPVYESLPRLVGCRHCASFWAFLCRTQSVVC